MDERIFYMNMCIKERYSARELARQIDSGYYERYMLSQNPIAPAIGKAKKATGNIFLDTYVLDFLDVPDTVSEYDLQKSIIRNLKTLSWRLARILPLSERNIKYKSETTITLSNFFSIIAGFPVWLFLN